MKKKISVILVFLLFALSVLGGLIARPCGFGRLVIINGWSEKLKVEVFDEDALLWQGTQDLGPPQKVRVRLPGDVAFRLRATDLTTKKVQEGTFGYDSDGMSQVNLFLIDKDGIHFKSWQIRPVWKALALLGLDTLSCVDEQP